MVYHIFVSTFKSRGALIEYFRPNKYDFTQPRATACCGDVCVGMCVSLCLSVAISVRMCSICSVCHLRTR